MNYRRAFFATLVLAALLGGAALSLDAHTTRTANAVKFGTTAGHDVFRPTGATS